jgi:curved DNA-binding protein CbpA
MRGPASAYSAYDALELEPGADRAAIEEAYRRLIKLHHPDRSGGDARRAAEINRAYFELRQAPEPERRSATRHRSHAGAGSGKARHRRRRSRLWLVLLLAVAAFVSLDGRFAQQASRWIGALADLRSPALVSGTSGSVRVDSSSIDGPLAESAIAQSVRQAVALSRRGDDNALIQYSRSCHREMRSRPDLTQLDLCAAFDNAVAAIADREPSSDSSAFNSSAVTARQMTAASLLSNDYLALERRLDRVRTRVELTLTPRAPPLPPVTVPDETGPESIKP